MGRLQPLVSLCGVIASLRTRQTRMVPQLLGCFRGAIGWPTPPISSAASPSRLPTRVPMQLQWMAFVNGPSPHYLSRMLVPTPMLWCAYVRKDSNDTSHCLDCFCVNL